LAACVLKATTNDPSHSASVPQM